jgi:hypothetical protein
VSNQQISASFMAMRAKLSACNRSPLNGAKRDAQSAPWATCLGLRRAGPAGRLIPPTVFHGHARCPAGALPAPSTCPVTEGRAATSAGVISRARLRKNECWNVELDLVSRLFRQCVGDQRPARPKANRGGIAGKNQRSAMRCFGVIARPDPAEADAAQGLHRR